MLNRPMHMPVDPALHAWLERRLHIAGDDVACEVSDRIFAAGESSAVVLVHILSDDKYLHDSGSLVPVHAATLLGELAGAGALQDERLQLLVLQALLQALERFSLDDRVLDAAVQALPQLGQAALEPLLASYPRTTNEELRGYIAEILVKLGVRDSRIAAILRRQLAVEPDLAVGYIGEYGDPALVEDVRRVIAGLRDPGRAAPTDDRLQYAETLLSAMEALEQMQVQVTEEESRLWDQALTLRDEMLARPR